jgi:hypothetical protein
LDERRRILMCKSDEISSRLPVFCFGFGCCLLFVDGDVFDV